MIKSSHAIAVTLALTLATAAAVAQPYGPGGMGGGMMSGGAGMMGSTGMCGFGPGMMGQDVSLPASIRLSDIQKTKYDAYRAAIKSAGDSARSSCDNEKPATTAPERMARMESHMATMLTAVTTIHSALDDFYNSLDDQQKTAFDETYAGPGGRGMMR